MIHYQLQCDRTHGFDGWFKDSAAFEHQAETGLITCPICASVNVTRALMAPALGRGSRHSPNATAPEALPVPAQLKEPSTSVPAVVPPPPGSMTESGMPDRVRALLQRLRSEVEKTCDYVGPEFAQEARRIHHGETKPRGIYGETTPAEADALADEGIEFGVVPWLPRSDS
jgi:hypothetical protein